MTEDSLESPFFKFSAQTWSTFKHSSDRLTMTEDDLRKCAAFNDKISLDEVSRIYLPLSRLLFLYYSSRIDRMQVLHRFLGQNYSTIPFIISISGPVSVGKTTTAKLLHELIKSWPGHPKVSLITTDGFLYPNAVLKEKMIMSRKGFPVSYDVRRLMRFLRDVKNGVSNVKVPVYSHLTYDVVEGEYTVVDRPNVLIIEGVNVLQNGSDYPEIRNHAFISDYIDYSIYVDADEENLLSWYVDRFLKLAREDLPRSLELLPPLRPDPRGSGGDDRKAHLGGGEPRQPGREHQALQGKGQHDPGKGRGPPHKERLSEEIRT